MKPLLEEPLLDDGCLGVGALGSAAQLTSSGRLVGVTECASGKSCSPDQDVSRVVAERLLLRCLTHERPIALQQASIATLDACTELLGDKAKPDESRSMKIRRLLCLTNDLRKQCAKELATPPSGSCWLWRSLLGDRSKPRPILDFLCGVEDMISGTKH